MDVETIMKQATPRPWDFDNTRKYYSDAVIRRNGLIIAKVTKSDLDVTASQWESNAKLITDAVNSYEPMREALLACVEALTHSRRWYDREGVHDIIWREEMDSALAHAREVLGEKS